MHRFKLALLLTALFLGLVACSGESDSGGGGDAATETDSAGTDSGYGAPAGGDDGAAEEPAAGASGVVASGNAFSPAELQLTADQASGVSVENADGVAHTFTIDELGVDQEIAGGETATVDVTAAAGTYTFFCRFHSGMEGTLTAA